MEPIILVVGLLVSLVVFHIIGRKLPRRPIMPREKRAVEAYASLLGLDEDDDESAPAEIRFNVIRYTNGEYRNMRNNIG